MRTSGDIVLRVRASTGRMLAPGLRLTRGAVKPSGQEAITVLRTAEPRRIREQHVTDGDFNLPRLGHVGSQVTLRMRQARLGFPGALQVRAVRPLHQEFGMLPTFTMSKNT